MQLLHPRQPVLQDCPTSSGLQDNKKNVDRQRIELWTFRMQSEHSTTELRAPRYMSADIITVESNLTSRLTGYVND